MRLAASAGSPDGAGERLTGAAMPQGRNSLLVAASLIATSMLGAAQAFALLVICGKDPRIEAFLAAYALYLPISVLGSSLRATVSSLVSRVPAADRGGHAAEIVSRCVLFGALVTGTMIVIAPLLAVLISGDLPASLRDTTTIALALLLPAAFLHLVAAALSGALGAHDQFGFSAAAYVATGMVALAVAIASLSMIGPLGAGVGVLTGTMFLAGAHMRRGRLLGIRLRLKHRALRERDQWKVTTQVLTGAALGFALQANLAISLAALGTQAGAITAYSYAFFMTTMILSLSSLPLALVTLPGLVGAVQRRGRAAVADHFVRLAPYAYAVVLPLVAGFLGFGRPVVEWAFEPFVAPGIAQLVFDVGRSLVLMALPATLFYLASAASLPATTPCDRLVVCSASIALHIVAITLVSDDPRAVAWAHAAAMLLSTIILLAQVLRRQTLPAMLRSLRAVFPVAIASSPILIIGQAAANTGSAATVAVAASFAGMIYLLVLRTVAPAVFAPFVALLHRSATR